MTNYKTYPMVSFRCDNNFRKALEQEAKRRNVSVSELIKEAVTKHLSMHQGNQ
jgi:predicted DNA-binding ribbon-helix-helix protein